MMSIDVPPTNPTNRTKGTRIAAVVATVTGVLLAVGGIVQAYTTAVDAIKQAIQASAAASAEPVATNGYQELAKQVEELSSQQLAIHDDVVRIQGYLEAISHPSVAGHVPEAARERLPHAAAAPQPPTLTASPKAVKPLSVLEIRQMSTRPPTTPSASSPR
jgi:hypothetical protein